MTRMEKKSEKESLFKDAQFNIMIGNCLFVNKNRSALLSLSSFSLLSLPFEKEGERGKRKRARERE